MHGIGNFFRGLAGHEKQDVLALNGGKGLEGGRKDFTGLLCGNVSCEGAHFVVGVSDFSRRYSTIAFLSSSVNDIGLLLRIERFYKTG